MKIERIIAIIMLLLERDRISATALAEMFEVSTRTIYRDIDTINLAGIPIVTYQGVNGGISIMDKYKVNKRLFTTDDISTLLTGLGSLSSALSGKSLINTLAKIESLIPQQQAGEIKLKTSQIAIDLSRWIGSPNLQSHLEKIKQAMNQSLLLTFNYSDGKGIKSQRQIEPYQLRLKEGNWYVHGYCIARQDFRLFKLSRITQLNISEQTFIPRPFQPGMTEGAFWIEKPLIPVTLLLDESVRDLISERCDEENIQPYQDNKILVNFPFVADDQGYHFLLGLGDKCECLQPEFVRNELIRRIKKTLAIYEQ
ncbi:transcriptional regulator [Brenneria goodwinii]|uniref:Transcriptional regulator n=2 Tax=Brenneria goodwinii TaxID=1109412 RepID=A0AAE8ETI2_9GAMM|nr:YafY family protein [Brenneria goodwinii]ATA23981.1 transcriptional regulator [Brenneria goodwinii]MCG8156610.1 YafY family transcriptional regulator [Brenneria goodwinii]MCG8159678.1 YafY family transcriptional regulator [Brenneria goodwinii]MCG8165768.1 YafY family transcriptional regulator [Brenneria goodwinii]MCG8170271.1 YafY family transcriptional regulator [Brenneria goodwinii]